MISRVLFLSAAIGWNGFNLLPADLPVQPKPLTAKDLREKGRDKSISNVCNKKKKSKTVRELCEQWKK